MPGSSERSARLAWNNSTSMANRFKSDGPTKRIKAKLESVGASVEYFKARAGRGNGGRPDLLIGYLGTNFLQEVKDEKGSLSDEQILYHGKWRGRKIDVVRNEAESLAAIGYVSQPTNQGDSNGQEG